MKKYIILFLVCSLVSCTYFTSKKTDTQSKDEQKTEKQKVEKGEKVEDKEPVPGDIQVIDGIEYIYARNKKYMITPYEKEYMWIRKDQYTGSISDSLFGGGKKERDELEKRLAKLEEDLKKKGLQMSYPSQMMYLPQGMGYMSMLPLVTFNYPSPKMKRHVLVLPVIDKTNYKEEHMGELATRRLISKLENTGTIICIDPNTINVKGELTSPQNMKLLNEIYGVHAIIKGVLSDIYTTTSKIEGKDEKEISFAMSKIAIDIYNTETTTILKQLSGRNPVSLSRERGDLSSEKAKIKAIDFTIEVIAEDLLKAILSIDWHARIASIEEGKIYINAGRLSNLAKGDVLEVYSPGEQKIDSKTKTPLGKIKGDYKGEVEVSEVFGVDASWAKIKKGGNFSATDLVFLKPKE
jgi:hypothetical protein